MTQYLIDNYKYNAVHLVYVDVIMGLPELRNIVMQILAVYTKKELFECHRKYLRIHLINVYNDGRQIDLLNVPRDYTHELNKIIKCASNDNERNNYALVSNVIGRYHIDAALISHEIAYKIINLIIELCPSKLCTNFNSRSVLECM